MNNTPIRSGKGWKSLNTVSMVRAAHVTDTLRRRRPETLPEIFPDSQALALFLDLPLTQTELKQFYRRGLRYQGNNRLQR